ncbi:2-hydroxyacyl-CoA dehydratase subunit D [Peptostreptococcus faecalis]|uniref:2-hydroxyacyl-CoA dehydratase subunit D n=1 Tax=Peptostreptococcus faecalis TaxID=2045015 RepID=UPI000C7A1E08|nr:2-hydroxyacyl-CoA dehydratase family protein [Peptostreptococcus faecalis]
MSDIKMLLEKLDVCPLNQIDNYVAQGKKVIGCAPVYTPEELVYAAGMVPIGIWGAEGEVNLSKEYFPAFYASVILRLMDLGLEGKLDKLSGMIIPGLSDGLKGLSQNWKKGIENVPCLYIGYGQNRKIKAGIDYNEKQYIKLKEELEKISGNKIEDSKVEEAIVLYNKHRKAMREFSALAATHLNTIKPSIRAKVMTSAFLFDKAEHLEIIEKINEELRAIPEEEFDGKKVVTTGIIANSPGIMEIFETHNLGIVDDNVNHESGQFDYLVDEGTANPVRALAKWISDIEGSTLLYDPEKLRGNIIVEKVKKHNANGVVYLLTKFSDSDEFDYPIIRDELNDNGILNLLVEVDQQMTNFEQANTALQTFADMI